MAEEKTRRRRKFKTEWKTPARKRNFFRTADGSLVLKRHSRGTRREVWNHTAHHTVGGLTKKDLMKNKRGAIVPKSRVFQGHKQARYLRDLGYCTQKNRFHLFPKRWAVASERRSGSLSRRRHNDNKKFCGPMDRLINPRAAPAPVASAKRRGRPKGSRSSLAAAPVTARMATRRTAAPSAAPAPASRYNLRSRNK